MKERMLRTALGAVAITVLVALSAHLPRAHSNPSHVSTTATTIQASAPGIACAPGEMTVVGGMSASCDFAAGVGVGLGIAGLFGCVVCGGISLGLAAGVLVFC